jgi:hypothetical protein
LKPFFTSNRKPTLIAFIPYLETLWIARTTEEPQGELRTQSRLHACRPWAVRLGGAALGEEAASEAMLCPSVACGLQRPALEQHCPEKHSMSYEHEPKIEF